MASQHNRWRFSSKNNPRPTSNLDVSCQSSLRLAFTQFKSISSLVINNHLRDFSESNCQIEFFNWEILSILADSWPFLDSSEPVSTDGVPAIPVVTTKILSLSILASETRSNCLTFSIWLNLADSVRPCRHSGVFCLNEPSNGSLGERGSRSGIVVASMISLLWTFS